MKSLHKKIIIDCGNKQSKTNEITLKSEPNQDTMQLTHSNFEKFIYTNTKKSFFPKSLKSHQTPNESHTQAPSHISNQYSTNTSTEQTSRNPRSIYDNYIISLKTIYHDPRKEKGINDNNTVDVDSSRQIHKKFRLKYAITTNEAIELKKNFMNSTLKNSNVMKSAAEQKYFPTFINVPLNDYRSPRSSLHTLKKNKAVFKKMKLIMSNQQVISYQEKYSNIINDKVKELQMPKLRIKNIPQKSCDIEEILNKNKASTTGSILQLSKDLRNDFIEKIQDYYYYETSHSNINPPTRSQSSFVFISYINRLLMFGGLSSYRLFDFWLLGKQDQEYKWKNLKPEGETFMPRYGHSTVEYKENVYIFGGNIQMNKYVPLEDILIYSLNENTLKAGKCNINKMNIPWRRNHIANTVGALMIVHGGYNDESVLLNDFLGLDLNNMAWIKLKIDYEKCEPVALAYHSSCIVISKDVLLSVKLSIYHFDKGSENIKMEGLYMFGGITSKGEYSNELYILKLGKLPTTFHKIKTIGHKPPKRSSCSLTYYEEMNFIILYGGKGKECYNDMFIFDVSTFNWTEIHLFGAIAHPRAEHIAGILHNKLIIFGGCNESTFLEAKVSVVELDFFTNRKKKKLYDYASKYHRDYPQDSTSIEILKRLSHGYDIPSTIIPMDFDDS